MGLKPKMSNILNLDEKGFVSAELADIVEIDAQDNKYGQEQYQFIFNCQAKVNPIQISIWTSTKLSAGESNDYNKLTKLLLAIGVVDEGQLPDLSDDDLESIGERLENLIGKGFKFKLSRTSERSRIKIDSVRLAT